MKKDQNFDFKFLIQDIQLDNVIIKQRIREKKKILELLKLVEDYLSDIVD